MGVKLRNVLQPERKEWWALTGLNPPIGLNPCSTALRAGLRLIATHFPDASSCRGIGEQPSLFRLPVWILARWKFPGPTILEAEPVPAGKILGTVRRQSRRQSEISGPARSGGRAQIRQTFQARDAELKL